MESKELRLVDFLSAYERAEGIEARADVIRRFNAWHTAEVERSSQEAKHKQRHQPLGVGRWIAVGQEHGYWEHPMTIKKANQIISNHSDKQLQPLTSQWQEEDTALDLTSPEAGVDTMGDDYPTEGQNSQRVH